MEATIQELDLLKLRSIRIRDGATHLVVIYNILDLLQRPSIEIEEISDIVTKSLRSSIPVSIQVIMDRYSNTNIEDMFFSNELFNEDLNLLCKIETNNYPNLRKHLFQVKGSVHSEFLIFVMINVFFWPDLRSKTMTCYTFSVRPTIP